MNIFRVGAMGVILTLMCSNIHAPEGAVKSRTTCWKGEVLESAASSTGKKTSLEKYSSHPQLVYGGFSLSVHPFDLPERTGSSLFSPETSFSLKPFPPVFKGLAFVPPDPPPRTF